MKNCRKCIKQLDREGYYCTKCKKPYDPRGYYLKNKKRINAYNKEYWKRKEAERLSLNDWPWKHLGY